MANQPSGAQNLPPTRIISFLQICQEADPNFQQGKLRPWIYSFSNGRLFYAVPNPYQ